MRTKFGLSADASEMAERRLIIKKLLPFKPEEETFLPASAVFSDEYLADVPLSLKSLLTLLHPKELMAGGAANLGIATAVEVNINHFREIDEDENLLRLRGRSAAVFGRAVAPLSTPKRQQLEDDRGGGRRRRGCPHQAKRRGDQREVKQRRHLPASQGEPSLRPHHVHAKRLPRRHGRRSLGW
jgi:hypothetical protein